VFIAFGDDGQIGPVVVNGRRSDTVRASIITHSLWNEFRIFNFTKNLRLLGIERTLDLSIDSQFQFFERQKEYAQILEQVRKGNKFSEAVQEIDNNEKIGETLLRLPYCKYITTFQEALSFLYPEGFQTPYLSKRAILCATNDDVDEWNSIVQAMNPNEPVTLIAANQFKDTDDPHGILKNMLTEDACMFYRQNGVPDHRITLKVGDLFGGFVLIRTQFPLRLAYAMTKNKSQGQSIPYTLNDIRHPPFSHGHLYVSMSRATDADNVAFFCNEDQIHDEAVVVTNVVYPEMLIT